MNGTVHRSGFNWVWRWWPVVALAAVFCVPPPGHLPEPAVAGTLFRPILLIAGSNGAYRVVDFAHYQHDRPVYTLTLLRTDSQTLTRFFGFFRRSAVWSYQLEATRFDAAGHSADTSSFLLPAAEMRTVRSLTVTELNRRAAGRGAVLEDLLERGQRSATVWCWQNLLTLLAYLVLSLTLIVFRPDRLKTRPRPAPPDNG